jgi:phosphoserine phosphatase
MIKEILKKSVIITITLMVMIITSCDQSDKNLENAEKSLYANILPSWKDGSTKNTIIQFVKEVTVEGSPNYVKPEERIATFDQDGTLWCEQPVAQLEFVAYQIKKMSSIHPEWESKQPYKSILEGDKDYLINDYINNHGRELKELIVTTHSGMTLEQFNLDVKEFMNSSLHPRFNRKYTKTVYQPMLELLQYLRDNEFKTYICSGGGNDFMRVFAEDLYGIGPENVIGTFAMNSFEQVDGSWKILKRSDNFFMNDGLTKPAAIEQRIGRIPIFVAGNVRSGGDIGQLTYSMTNKLPNFQLLVNHDDDIREFAYSEKNNASLNAASEGKWQVVSMKNDWLTIFSFK